MKTATLLTVLVILASQSGLVAGPTENRPTGTLNVAKKLVRTGVRPLVNWQIQFPESIDDVVKLDAMNSVTAQKDLLVEVRVVGTSYQPYGEDATVECSINIDGADWQMIFSGKTADLRASEPVFSQVVDAGTTIDISGRGQKSSSWWTPDRKTGVSTYNVMALTDGDEVPYYSPAFQQGDIESHVSSYVNNGKVVLNPRDVIYLVELGQNDPNRGGFDMQDLVVVISFKDLPSNNGHGNNLDGVDVSNPGKGGGGPNGEVDLSGDFDDERK